MTLQDLQDQIDLLIKLSSDYLDKEVVLVTEDNWEQKYYCVELDNFNDGSDTEKIIITLFKEEL